MPQNILPIIAIYALPILFAITLHEAAHGYAARKFGDNTAYILGRITLNPFKHIDPVGTLLLPIALAVMGLPIIGYAKPVPVNFRNLKPFKQGVALVALAGPAANLLLIFVSIFAMHLAVAIGGEVGQFTLQMAAASVQINAILMLFNLLPIPPLDGSRVLSVILPPRLSVAFAKFEQYAMVLIILLAVSGMLGYILFPMLNALLSLFTPLMP